MYQRRSQPIVKAKWKVKAVEGVGSSKASKKDNSLVVSRKEVMSGEVVEEGAIGGLVTAQMSTKLDVRAFGSCKDKTEGLFGISVEGIVDEIPVSSEIA